MKINFLGDSITNGAGASVIDKCYVSRVGQILGCTANNYGIGGTRIARQTVPSEEAFYDKCFLDRAKIMDKDADLVFVFGGTNDYGHGDADMGEIDGTDEYTFCGAVNSLLNYLINEYGKEKLTVILPMPRYNSDSIYGEGKKTTALYPLSAYVENIEKIAKAKGIPCLDFSKDFPQPLTNSGDKYTIDGLHPNDLGHDKLANLICEYIKSL